MKKQIIKGKKNEIRKIKKNVKGITLIALVVTIIVLLILAAVAINLTIGDNGIIKRAKDSVEIYLNKAKEEEEALNIFEEKDQEMVKNFITSKNILGLDKDGNLYVLYGNNSELKGKQFEIINYEWIYCKETDKYYFIESTYEGVSLSPGIKLKKKFEGLYDIGITEDNKLVKIEYNRYENPLKLKTTELLTDINIKNMEYIYTYNAGYKYYEYYLIEDINGIQYLWDKDNLTNLTEKITLSENNKIKKALNEVMFILENNNIILLKDNKEYLIENEKDVILSRGNGTFLKLDDGRWYTIYEGENSQIILYPIDGLLNFEDDYITDIGTNANFIKTNSGKMIYGDEDLTNFFTEKINEDISDFDGEYATTASGKLYRVNLEKKEVSLIESNLEKKIKNFIQTKNGNIKTIGEDNNIEYDFSQLQKYYLVTTKLKNIKAITENFILLEDGSLYRYTINYNKNYIPTNLQYTRVEETTLNNNVQWIKNLYIGDFIKNAEGDIICFDSETYTNLSETNEIIKNNEVKDITENYILTEDGKVLYYDFYGNNNIYSFDDEANNIINKNKIMQIEDSNLLLTENGTVFKIVEDYGNKKISLEQINTDGKKVKKIGGPFLLTEDGELFYQDRSSNIINLSQDKDLNIYNKEITDFLIFSIRNVISWIITDSEGEVYNFYTGILQ